MESALLTAVRQRQAGFTPALILARAETYVGIEPLPTPTVTITFNAAEVLGPISYEPLTTTFTPDSACFTDVFDLSISSGLRSIAPSQFALAPLIATQCYPGTKYSLTGLETYSPGLCPSGYALGNFPPAGSPATTLMVCCPSALRYLNNQCITEIEDPNQGPIITTLAGVGPIRGSLTSTTSFAIVGIKTLSSGSQIIGYSADTTVTTAITTRGRITITAPVFTVMFQSTDTAVSSEWDRLISIGQAQYQSRLSTYSEWLLLQQQPNSTLSSTLSSLSALGTGVASATRSTSRSIGSGAIAGIVIGAVAALLFVIGAVLFGLRRRRRLRRDAPSGDHEADAKWVKAELDSKQVQPREMDGEHEIKELPTHQGPPVELPAVDLGPGFSGTGSRRE